MRIDELIPNIGIENENVEFKGIIEQGDDKELKWLRTLAAFANTSGGELYVGVEDKSHTVVALDHKTADKVVLMVHRLVRERIEPMIDYDVSSITVPNARPPRYVLRIHVPRSLNLPVTVHSAGLLGVYVRRFGTTSTATPEQIRDLVLMSENIPFDRSFTDREYHEEDFSRLLDAHLRRTGEALSRKELISMGFMSPEDLLSKGALLFADCYSGELTRVVATLWPHTSKGDDVVLASEEYSGDLIGSIEFARTFVENHSAAGYRKSAGSREEFRAYPERSVTEGVVNAVGHRNYYMQGTQVEVNLFADRLEITSPGALLGTAVVKREFDIASIIPRRRNEVICNVLASCRYMEEKGSGFDKIAEDYRGRGDAYRPFICSDGTSFTLTLPNLVFAGGVDGGETETPDVYIDGVVDGRYDLPVLSFCYRSGRTAREIAQHLGMSTSTYFRHNVLAPLVDAGYLTTGTAGRATRYTSNRSRVFLKG